MRIWQYLYLTMGLLLLAGGTARAQDPGKIGITMAFPGSIGIIWHATDKVAIRPDFVFSQSSSDGISMATGWAFGTNVSALLYMRKYDNVRTYFSPRFGYTRNSSSVTSSTAQTDLTVTSSSTGGAGSFGAEFSPAARFSVFGEVGLAFSHRSVEPESSLILPTGNTSLKTTSNGWGTIAGVGVVFYF